MRAAVLAAGGKALGVLLEGIGVGRREEPVVCVCGLQMESLGLKDKPLMTILGEVSYRRSMFRCPACGATRYPGDEELDVVGTTRSPGLRRMMARAGSQSTFKEGREDLRVYASIDVSPKDVERVAEISASRWKHGRGKNGTVPDHGPPMRVVKTIPVMYVCYDGTGVPMTRTELAGRKGKQEDGSALTREAKLGCVFTQTTTDEEGFAVRDPDSTSFVGAIESSDDLGWRIYAEAVRRGLYRQNKLSFWEMRPNGSGRSRRTTSPRRRRSWIYITRENMWPGCASTCLGKMQSKLPATASDGGQPLDEGKVEKTFSRQIRNCL